MELLKGLGKDGDSDVSAPNLTTANGYKGLRLAEEGEFPDLAYPPIKSWRQAPKGRDFRWQSGLYTARPLGSWVALIRKEDQVVATLGTVPLSVDWEHVYEMLGQEQAVLYARTTGEVLTAVAVGQAVGLSPKPLTPGFQAETTQVVSGMTEEQMAGLADSFDWPGGLVMPWILHLGPFNALTVPEHRQTYLAETNGHGLWVQMVDAGGLTIYEVLA